ncbi:hypothetical protein CANCADRAFT_124610 [Tortispora caseinolytica NRRL Y-17796]|uniref:tRNA-splicing endonuclease subunit Sen15 domain-containing protein n=1 Tax=Tortispora caseinolytica NRRL Y-17796 TaxID=767744 RepID=A0A1E4T9X1_9ASCO|nr:hypothetical protein CANCADRAFT_124610 [Tortispora caseinolytica NRRL Y-17796]
MTSTVESVKTALEQQNNWINVSELSINHNNKEYVFLIGTPSTKIRQDDEAIKQEIVFPCIKESPMTLRQWAQIDDTLTQKSPIKYNRFLLAMLGNDSTIAFYVVYKGLIKPKQ